MATDGYLGDIIPIIALGISGAALVISAVVPAVLFYLGHTRSKKSEQIHIARECWDRIWPISSFIRDWLEKKKEDRQSSESREDLTKALRSLRNEFDFFVFLIEKKVIRDTEILEYFRDRGRLHDIHYIARRTDKYGYAGHAEYPEAKHILDLVKKYHELAGKPEEFKDQDSKIYP